MCKILLQPIMSEALKFDNMTVKLEEAEKYMKQHNCTFYSVGYERSDQFTNDVYGNKIFYDNYVRSEPFSNTGLSNPPDLFIDSVLSEKLNKLVEDIKSRQSLFAEVDYLLRKRPKEQTLSYDLKLITQNLMYISSSPQRKIYKSNVLVMKENSPLATLGFVAQLLCAHKEIIIESEVNTAVLCYIFTTMCHKAGLDNVKLAFVKISEPGANDVTELPELQYGCAAVIAGNGDVDSAVDAIINAPNVYPWHLKRVFVQECIGKRFLQALAWKCGVAVAPARKEYHVNGKLFHHESTGAIEGIAIEEYRTVKELLSLYKDVPLALSLWCSDVCEANEIAHGVPSPLVWVGGFGQMSGPPAASQAFYSILDTTFGSELILAINKPVNVGRWAQRSPFERREAIVSCLKQKNMQLVVPRVADRSFAMANGNGLLCIGVVSPAGSVFVKEGCRPDKFLSAIIDGSIVVDNGLQSALCSALQCGGIPILSTSGDSYTSLPSVLSMHRTKVVWTNFGTTFAN